MSDNLEIPSVRTQAEFSSFVQHLRSDLLQNADAWQNGTLDSFLEALSAWVDDMDGYYRNRGEPVPEPDWTTFAHMLMAARVYE
jgi:hypothetical protein